jgi:hypothetical protein
MTTFQTVLNSLNRRHNAKLASQRKLLMSPSIFDQAHFLNVDLIIYSRSDLQPLISAMGKHLIVLYLGREGRVHKSCVEVSGMPKTPESAIRAFCKLIENLSPADRKLWDNAKTRTFDIGVDSGPKDSYFWFPLSPEILARAAVLNARIAVTVYGKLQKAKLPRKTRIVGSLK